MSCQRVYVPIYIDKWKAMTEALTEQERNKVMAAYLDYAIYDKEPRGLTRMGKVLFTFMRSTADDLKKNQGGAPEGNHNAKKKTTEKQPVNSTEKQPVVLKTKQPVKSNQKQPPLYTETETETETETNTNTEVCAPLTPQGAECAPTLDEVRKFAEESGLKNINPVRFYKYYKAMGWKRKGEPIEDWRSLMEYWTEPETPPEPEKPYHPVEKLTECPLCHSTNVENRGLDGICNGCGKHLMWSTARGEWHGEGA